MRFSKVRIISTFIYNINGETLYQTIRSIKKSFGIFFIYLNFYGHINNIINILNKIMGFIHRNCIDINV